MRYDIYVVKSQRVNEGPLVDERVIEQYFHAVLILHHVDMSGQFHAVAYLPPGRMLRWSLNEKLHGLQSQSIVSVIAWNRIPSLPVSIAVAPPEIRTVNLLMIEYHAVSLV